MADLLYRDDDLVRQWSSRHWFECVLCGCYTSPEIGCYDAIERVLGDSERGVCDPCFARLPEHVKQWVEDRENRE